MTGFNPYITFDGNCEEALKFYESCFSGKTLFIQHYEEIPVAVSKPFKSKVMHSEFKAGSVHFMACDKAPGQTIHPGTNITLYINFSSSKEQENIFNKLSAQGTIHMPLEPTFWGSRMGILTDRFGIHWMLVLERN
jgi:PhnB protein